MTNNVILDLTAKLASKLEQVSQLQDLLTAINGEVADIRDHLQQQMETGSYKSLEANGLQVAIRSKSYPQVVDADALKAHIESLGIIADYTVTRYDETKAKRDGAKNGWPGIEVEERDELVVKAVAS